MLVVEFLTVRVWLLVVWPRLAWWRLTRRRTVDRCFVIDATAMAMGLARASGAALGVKVETLQFRLVDVRDEQGLLIRLSAFYQDLAEVQADVVTQPEFQAFLARCGTADRLGAAVAKSVATVSLSDRATLWRLLLLVRIAEWKARGLQITGVTLVAERRAWGAAVARYASRHGVALIEVGEAFSTRLVVWSLMGPRGLSLAREWRNRLAHNGARAQSEQTAPTSEGGWHKLAVSYHGQFSVNDPSRYSDLFFWQQSAISGRDLLMLFEFPQDPVDSEKWRQLNEHGIGAVALYPGASTVSEVPLYAHTATLRSSPREQWATGVGNRLEKQWLKKAIGHHETSREYWTDLFASKQVKIYVSWFRYDANHYAIADALESLGGVTAIYQRAHQPDPSPEISVHADLMFGYSPRDAEVERRSGSIIPYHVAVGYFGDHRFPMLRSTAASVQESLRRNGAAFTVAYFDENSADDERWHTGHQFMRDNYAFLLERVLAEPTLGLVLKPKYPSTLRRRLGPVAGLLERAMATGRCFMFEEGPLHGAMPPAVAAYCADVAIHGHLCAATAGLEAALAGIPTLLLDREGWGISSMYELGVGSVVFTEWPELWRAVTEQRRQPGVIKGFGDWSSMIDTFDPFRDGRGAERMGTFLLWVLDGLKSGLKRDTVLADAAERYASQWGADKVNPVNVAGRRGEWIAPAPLQSRVV